MRQASVTGQSQARAQADVRLLQWVALGCLRPQDLARLSAAQLYKFLPLVAQLAAQQQPATPARALLQQQQQRNALLPLGGSVGSALAAAVEASAKVAIQAAGRGQFTKAAAALPQRSYAEEEMWSWEQHISGAVWCSENVVLLSQFALWLTRCGLLSLGAVSPTTLDTVLGHSSVDKLSEARTLSRSNDFILSQFTALAANPNPVQGQIYDLHGMQVFDPIFGKPDHLEKMEVMKVFDSQAKPCLMKLSYTASAPSLFIFKCGDDLRRDLMVQVMFNIFNSVWDCSGLELKPHAFTYRVVPVSRDRGLIELVSNAVPLTNFCWDSILAFDDRELNHFVATAAGGYVSAFLMGVRDRHKDNMLIKDGHTFFQIDFGYLFNTRPWFDANRFAMPHDFKLKMQQRGGWKRFLDVCENGLAMLRRESGMLMRVCSLLFDKLLDNHAQLINTCMHSAFYLDRTEDEARMQWRVIIDNGVSSYKNTGAPRQHGDAAGVGAPDATRTAGLHTSGWVSRALVLH
eukprot:TRINITY_DN3837_c0_g1_i11.p1 TRINITY_DN3837_c0_g1~~TRINITY_DN3837_c0_g1_i11.p1  ORF type:complete len:529 (-),score=96.36 TRINITY_DN3837_c0_g1_i11:343-1893(-)